MYVCMYVWRSGQGRVNCRGGQRSAIPGLMKLGCLHLKCDCALVSLHSYTTPPLTSSNLISPAQFEVCFVTDADGSRYSPVSPCLKSKKLFTLLRWIGEVFLLRHLRHSTSYLFVLKLEIGID